MTKDNLLKRGIEKPKECMFCLEESICHFFVSVLLRKSCGTRFQIFLASLSCYADVAGRWLDCIKIERANTISAGVLWCIYLTRNDLVFHSQLWMDIKQVFRRIWRCVQVWRAMFKQSMVREVDRWCSYLEALIATPSATMAS